MNEGPHRTHSKIFPSTIWPFQRRRGTFRQHQTRRLKGFLWPCRGFFYLVTDQGHRPRRRRFAHHLKPGICPGEERLKWPPSNKVFPTPNLKLSCRNHPLPAMVRSEATELRGKSSKLSHLSTRLFHGQTSYGSRSLLTRASCACFRWRCRDIQTPGQWVRRACRRRSCSRAQRDSIWKPASTLPNDIVHRRTDADGRCMGLLPPSSDSSEHTADVAHLKAGLYKIVFKTREYFERMGKRSFYPWVEASLSLFSASLYRTN
jgi:hypothetical protein